MKSQSTSFLQSLRDRELGYDHIISNQNFRSKECGTIEITQKLFDNFLSLYDVMNDIFIVRNLDYTEQVGLFLSDPDRYIEEVSQIAGSSRLVSRLKRCQRNIGNLANPQYNEVFQYFYQLQLDGAFNQSHHLLFSTPLTFLLNNQQFPLSYSTSLAILEQIYAEPENMDEILQTYSSKYDFPPVDAVSKIVKDNLDKIDPQSMQDYINLREELINRTFLLVATSEQNTQNSR